MKSSDKEMMNIKNMNLVNTKMKEITTNLKKKYEIIQTRIPKKKKKKKRRDEYGKYKIIKEYTFIKQRIHFYKTENTLGWD